VNASGRRENVPSAPNTSIPATRGAPRSVPIQDVVREVKRVAAAGFKEVALTGVHLGSYGRDLESPASLVGLLRTLSPVSLLRDSTSVLRIRTERARSLLLIGQMGLTTLLLSLAALALHSFMRVSSFDVGFDAAQVWSFSLPGTPPAATAEAEAAAVQARFARIRESVAALEQTPGAVSSAAAMPVSTPQTKPAAIQCIDFQ